MVTIYTQPTCQPCRAVEARLTSAGVPFIKRDITVDEEARQEIAHAGFLSTPVLEFRGRLSDITELSAIIKKATA